MTPVLTALIPLPGSAPTAAGIGSVPASPANGTGSAHFRVQFGQALAALSSTGSTTNGTPVPSTQAGGLDATDALQAALQKKIADALAQGTSVTDIVNQLAAALANQFAGTIAGDPTQIRTQLQAAFATALSPPGKGPPGSSGDLASTLAERYRQIAEAAAGVTGETGQSSRLFAGSISDAASTAGVQPAPDPNNGPGPQTADSTVAVALGATADLTASTGDGKTVASSASTPAVGTNGDTPLGRVLARALNAQSSLDAAPITPTLIPQAALGAAPSFVSASPSLSSVASLLGASVATSAPTLPSAAAATNAGTGTQLAAFLQTFTAALAADQGASTATVAAGKPVAEDDGFNSLLSPANNSSNAPTVSAFVPVQPPFELAQLGPDASQSAAPVTQPAVDPNSVIDQVLRGAVIRTDGTTSQVRLNLVPASLGDVNVQLNVTGGNVSAHIVAQTADARDALLAGQDQLTRSLADAGLKLTSFNVDLAGGGFAGFGQQHQSSAQPQSSHGASVAAIASEDENAAIESLPTSAPALAPSATIGAVNYLV